MIALLLAFGIPNLFWEPGPETASALRQAGIECPYVRPEKMAAWKAAGRCVMGADPSIPEKMLVPGVQYRMNEASASRSPWIDSNGWRFQRIGRRIVVYDLPKGKALLGLAEAAMYDAEALMRIDPSDIGKYGEMVTFLKSLDQVSLPQRVNIGFQDDGTALSGEMMNLMARKNLLFKLVKQPDPKLDLNLKPEGNNPHQFAVMARQKLGDDKRLVRLYGSETTLVRFESNGTRARLHLLNYSNRKSEGLQLRVLGNWKKVVVHLAPSETEPASQGPASDLAIADGATEFTIPALSGYAVVELQQN
jgi:hypothetical protein